MALDKDETCLNIYSVLWLATLWCEPRTLKIKGENKVDEYFGWFMVLLIVATIIVFALAVIVHAALILIIVFAIALPIIAIAKGVKWYAKKPKAMSLREYLWSWFYGWEWNFLVALLGIAALVAIAAIVITMPIASLIGFLLKEPPSLEVVLRVLTVLYTMTSIPVSYFFIFPLEEERDGRKQRKTTGQILEELFWILGIWVLSWCIATTIITFIGPT